MTDRGTSELTGGATDDDGAATGPGGSRAGGLPLPQGVRLLRFDEALEVEVLAGELSRGGTPLGLAEALAVRHREPLEAAARDALADGGTTLRCESSGPCAELVVRLGPDPNAPGAGLALAFEANDLPPGATAGERAEELELIALTARELARSTDAHEARSTACQLTLSICGADVALILELDAGHDALSPTVGAGLTVGPSQLTDLPLAESSAATLALRTNVSRFVADARAEPTSVRTLLDAAGVSSSLWQPIARGRTVRAIMMIGWRRPVAAVHPLSARLLEVISVEAAVAVDRGSAFSRLVSMARTDPLTGLPNRRAWEETLGRELARAGRERTPLTVAMLDLDGFKAYNDARGHPAGDRLLARVAAAWRPLVRASDVLARFGGDEFALLLPQCEPSRARELLDRLASLPEVGIGFCAGAAAWDGEEPAQALLGRADRALYRAKSAGPGRAFVDGEP